MRSKFDALVVGDRNMSVDPLGQAEKSKTTILFDGLTFLCDWSVSQPNVASSKKIFSTISDDMFRGAMGLALHPHIDQGLRIPEIAKAFLALGASFAKQLGAIGLLWRPASLQIDPDYFVEVVDSYLSGGVFPVLPIVDFEFEDAEGVLRSSGLHLFCGQEFEIQSDHMERQELIRRAIRLAHDLATNGAVEEEQDVPDIDVGKIIRLTPNTSGNLLKCQINSNVEQIVTLG
ncbi:MAG: hypothetical protein WA793_05035 [Sphingorhabdus sp.]|uniref:hypothetical protein n=1 Tax=Sphingorhabdus sp. TaxID=1902408 RepID=UPI003CB17778